MCAQGEAMEMENDLDAWCDAMRALEDGEMTGKKRPSEELGQSSTKHARLSIVGDPYFPPRESTTASTPAEHPSPHRRSHSPAHVGSQLPRKPHLPLGRGDHHSSPESARYRSDGLVKLTEIERKWICAHDGCFKCRRIGVYHTSSACPTGHPKASKYRGITLADGITLAKAREDKVAEVAWRLDVARSVVEQDDSGEEDGSDQGAPSSSCPMPSLSYSVLLQVRAPSPAPS
ncbi:hypothetical protein BDZ89DRAFT_1134614 [Hymenopellis radicata]|nr:hypothetical protein BDZ89DRAFT_1134614 [Hymenopellis radicata]